jgi:hypothetical protein
MLFVQNVRRLDITMEDTFVREAIDCLQHMIQHTFAKLETLHGVKRALTLEAFDERFYATIFVAHKYFRLGFPPALGMNVLYDVGLFIENQHVCQTSRKC